MILPQIVFITALIVALRLGRAHWAICGVMLFNFIGTWQNWNSYLSVGVFDVICATMLLFTTNRGRAVSAIFVLMVPIYVMAHHFMWRPATTYTIVDLLAYLQLGIIGRVDTGISHIYRAAIGRFNHFGYTLEKGRDRGKSARVAAFSDKEVTRG